MASWTRSLSSALVVAVALSAAPGLGKPKKKVDPAEARREFALHVALRQPVLGGEPRTARGVLVATLALRGAMSGGNFLMVVGPQMLVGAAALFVVALAVETPRVNPTWPLLLAFIYTTLVPGLAATLVWFLLVNRIGAIRAATFHFLNPVFGVAIPAVLLGERLGPRDILAVAIITLGILAVQLARQTGRAKVTDQTK